MRSLNDPDELITCWLGVFENFAHALKTPLSSIKLPATCLKGALPTLLHAYQLATAAKLVEDEIDTNELEKIASAPVDVLDWNAQSFRLLEQVSLLFQKILPTSAELQQLSMNAYINNFVDNYAMTKRERSLIAINITDDFLFNSTLFCMDQLMSRLLETVLACWRVSQTGKIELFTQQQDHHQLFVFKVINADTTPDDLFSEKLSHFFTNTGQEVIAELGLCRLMLAHFGGSIKTDYKKGEYTQFLIKFPAMLQRNLQKN